MAKFGESLTLNFLLHFLISIKDVCSREFGGNYGDASVTN